MINALKVVRCYLELLRIKGVILVHKKVDFSVRDIFRKLEPVLPLKPSNLDYNTSERKSLPYRLGNRCFPCAEVEMYSCIRR